MAIGWAKNTKLGEGCMWKKTNLYQTNMLTLLPLSFCVQPESHVYVHVCMTFMYGVLPYKHVHLYRNIRLIVTALVDGQCCQQSIVVYQRRKFFNFFCHICFEYMLPLWGLNCCLASFGSIYGIKTYCKISLLWLIYCLFIYMLVKHLSFIWNIDNYW